MNDPSHMMNRGFGMWQPPMPPAPGVEETMGFGGNPRAVFAGTGGKPGWVNWKGKKAADKRKKAAAGGGGGGGGGVSGYNYKPPTLSELQLQNQARARRFYSKSSVRDLSRHPVYYPKKKFARFAAPLAPRNTTSFIIRAKKSGGIAPLVSPCPVTPAILPTPKFSPSREGLVDMAKEEWGVDGYGSMKGRIRLRSPTGRGEEEDDAAAADEGGSSESDVEEHVEVERRLDHDLSRFEMLYPAAGEEHGPAAAAAYLLENRVDDQDAHIAQLEEENLTLKERLFLVEREMGDLRRRLQLLETECRVRDDNNNNNDNNEGDDDDNNGSNDMNVNNEEASEIEGGGGGDVCSEKSMED